MMAACWSRPSRILARAMIGAIIRYCIGRPAVSSASVAQNLTASARTSGLGMAEYSQDPGVRPAVSSAKAWQKRRASASAAVAFGIGTITEKAQCHFMHPRRDAIGHPPELTL